MNSDDLGVMHSPLPKRIQAVITTYGGVTECKMTCQIIAGNDNMFCCYGTIHVLSHYKKSGYNINALQKTAFLVVNPITVGNIAFLFNCTPVGRTSDSMTVLT